MRLIRRVAAGTALLLPLTGCQLLADVVGSHGIYESEVTPVDLDLPAPTYAVATRDGLVVRAGDVRRVFRDVREVEWLPGGRALLYVDGGVRIWDPADDELGRVVDLGSREDPFVEGDVKRSVTQIVVVLDPDPANPGSRLTAYDLDLERRWQVELPGADDRTTRGQGDEPVERSYRQGHTIDGVTYLMWSEFDPDEEESDPHYGLLRVDEDGTVLGSVQVDERITSTWLSSDGASLLALRRVSGHPCGGCQVTLELVELDPATGEVVRDYGMPDDYDKDDDVVEVDKVGDRVAVRLEAHPRASTGSGPAVRLGGTWVRDDDGWSLLDGSTEEISWWQGPDDRVVARPTGENPNGEAVYALWWEHDGERTRIPGSTERWSRGGRQHRGSVPGHALPPG